MTRCLIAGDGKPEPDGLSGFNSLSVALPTLRADTSNIAPPSFEPDRCRSAQIFIHGTTPGFSELDLCDNRLTVHWAERLLRIWVPAL